MHWVINISLGWWPTWAFNLWCWWFGISVVPAKVEKLAREIGQLDYQDSDGDDGLTAQKDSTGVVTHHRLRRRTPYVHRVVMELRGGELGQLEYSVANRMIVEKYARDLAKQHKVRSFDFARVLPLVVSVYFYCPDVYQIEAEQFKHTELAIARSKELSARYYSRRGHQDKILVA